MIHQNKGTTLLSQVVAIPLLKRSIGANFHLLISEMKRFSLLFSLINASLSLSDRDGLESTIREVRSALFLFPDWMVSFCVSLGWSRLDHYSGSQKSMFDMYPVALSPAQSRWRGSVYRLLDVYLCILSHCSCQSDIWAWSDVNRWPRLAAGRGRKYQSRKHLILLIVHRIFVLAFSKVSSWTWSLIGRFMSANVTRDYELDTCMDKRSI